jgi:hypothetical protein
MARKRLYATFNMAGFVVPVYIMPAKMMEKQKQLGCAYGGGHNPRIYLHEGLRGEKFQNVLLHEMLHTAADCAGITLSEKQVEGLTGMLRQAAKTMKKGKRR